jgi:hypothetical protein
MTSHLTFEQEDELRKDLIAMYLFIADGPIRSKVKFQKELFLLTQSFPNTAPLFGFISYKFGPYSDSAASVIENNSDIFFEANSKIQLTPQGKIFGKEIFLDMDEKKREQMAKASKMIHSICNSLSDDELMFLIYFTYGYETNSDVFFELYNKREEIAQRLLSKNIITHQKYREIVRGIY